mgnify:CR=1 FL=1
MQFPAFRFVADLNAFEEFAAQNRVGVLEPLTAGRSVEVMRLDERGCELQRLGISEVDHRGERLPADRDFGEQQPVGRTFEDHLLRRCRDQNE